VIWRLSLLAVVLGRFRGRQARIQDLHLMFWALRTSTTRNLLASWWSGVRAPDLATVRIEPGLDVTVALAVAEGIATVTTTGKIKLTQKGLAFAQSIDSEGGLMVAEKELLTVLQPLNETEITRRMGGVAV
jgi:hypothetical protein